MDCAEESVQDEQEDNVDLISFSDDDDDDSTWSSFSSIGPSRSRGLDTFHAIRQAHTLVQKYRRQYVSPDPSEEKEEDNLSIMDEESLAESLLSSSTLSDGVNGLLRDRLRI